MDHDAKHGVSPDGVTRDVLPAVFNDRLFCVTLRRTVAPAWPLQRIAPKIAQALIRRRDRQVLDAGT